MVKIAVVSPSFCAPVHGPEVHEQALKRLAQITGLQVVETPTTRTFGASPAARAADLNALYADPEVCCIMATTGGDDEITILPFLDEDVIISHPKPFLGYSDNTHLLNWLWHRKLPGFYGGSTQVHIGSGPAVDDVHEVAIKAILNQSPRVQITNPSQTEDHGFDWQDPRSLTEYGEREPMPNWDWTGPAGEVSGKTWGGCVESLTELLVAGALQQEERLDGSVLLLETSEQLIDPFLYGSFLRALGERGLLGRCGAVIFAHPPTSSPGMTISQKERASYRRDLRDLSLGVLGRYAPDAVGVFGVPFGHTRPQWILPYGGEMTLDSVAQKIHANYSWQNW